MFYLLLKNFIILLKLFLLSQMDSTQGNSKNSCKGKLRFQSETPSPKNRSTLSKDKQQHKEPPISLESLWCSETLNHYNTKPPILIFEVETFPSKNIRVIFFKN